MRNVNTPKLVASGNQIGDVVQSVRTGRDANFLRLGIVYEYISNNRSLSNESLQIMIAAGLDKPTYEKAPPNSLIVKPIEKGQAHMSTTIVVCYPMNPHLSTPVKVGEMVLFYSPSDILSSVDPCYWISRVSLSDVSEDLNYAHFSRQYTDINDTSFPNGTRSESGELLPGGDRAFDELYEFSTSKKNIKNESSPRIINDTSGFFHAGSNRQVVCGGVYRGIPYCEISILGKPASRTNSRELEESDPTRRGDLFLSQNSPLSGTKIAIYEQTPQIQGAIGIESSQSGDLGNHNVRLQGTCSIINSDNVVATANRNFCAKGGNSYVSIIDNSILLNTREALFKCESVVFGTGNNLQFKIGGSGANQNLILGKRLQEWSNKLIDIVENFVSDLANQTVIVPPTPAPPLPFSGLVAEYGVLSSQVIADLNSLREEFSKNLSNVGYLVDSAEGD